VVAVKARIPDIGDSFDPVTAGRAAIPRAGDSLNRGESEVGPIVSKRALNIMAGVVWYAGGVALLRKGTSLVLDAHELRPDESCAALAVSIGLVLGAVKAKFIFSGSCRRNLTRIAGLAEPRALQFFRPGFFVALAAMILSGVLLSRLAQVHYSLLCAVAALDLTIAVALLGSSYVFWKRRAFS